MNLKVLECEHNDKKFVIKEDYPEIGAYLYVYKENKCIEDYLQNDIHICKIIAFEEFNVPMDKWELVSK